jgi:hypothetical protein
MPTAVPEVGRTAKPGLLHNVHRLEGAGTGTPAPGEGYALTIAARVCATLVFDHPHDRADVALGVALVAAKRASLIGRGPTLGDVRVAMSLFGLREGEPVTRAVSAPFLGLAHSYPAQRRFVDAVAAEALLDDTPSRP